jgi:two-component SAPR family response regulator
LFLAKTRAPLLPEPHLQRARLMAVLQRSLQRRVTLITSPAGSGKTTALAELAQSLPPPIFWYTVDELDRDDVALLHGLALAVGATPPLARDRQSLLAQIIRALGQPIEQSRLIVDDIHRLEAATAQRALADLVRYMPRSVRLVLAGRNAPPQLGELIEWCALQRQLSRLTWHDLQLTEYERKQAATVLQVEGRGAWVLNWTHPDDISIDKYLRDEVISQLDLATIHRLGRLSVLPGFDSELAASMLEVSRDEARDFLTRAYDRLPLLERPSAEVYRFSEQAREILSRSLGDRVVEAQSAAARALQTIDPARSAEIFHSIGDLDRAAESLALLPLSEWLVQSPNPPHQTLERLPPAVAHRDAKLVLASAWAETTWKGGASKATDLLSIHVLSASDPAMDFWWNYVLARASLAQGDRLTASNAYQHMSAATASLRRSADSDPRVVAQVMCRLAIAERLLGLESKSGETARQGLSVAYLSPETTPNEQLLLHHTLGNMAYLDGDYRLADQHLASAATLSGTCGDVAEQAAIAHIQAGVARNLGELSRALEILGNALRNPLLPQREKALLTLQTGHVLSDIEDFRGAGNQYRVVSSMVREPDRDGCFSRALAGYAGTCAMLGLVDEAAASLARLRALNGVVGLYNVKVAEGICQLQSNAYADAERSFREARQTTNSIGGYRDQWQALLLEAQASLAQGNARGAEDLVRDFVAKSRPDQPLPTAALWAMRPVEALLASIETTGEYPRLTALLRKAGRHDPASPRLRHYSSALNSSRLTRPHEIEIHLFGQGRVIVDGKDLVWPYGFRRKAIELFWYGLLHPEGFTREQAIADLCPDLDQLKGQRLVQVSVAELRSALGQSLETNGNQLLPREADGRFYLRLSQPEPGFLRIDTDQVRALLDGLQRRQLPELPVYVPEFFRGEFLAGYAMEWVGPIRRFWTSIYLRTLGALATRYSRRGELQEAIRCHELALNVDPTLESSHRALMRLYHTAGDRPALDAQMWLYTRATRDELDAEVNPDVETLFRKLSEKAQT